MHPVTLQCIPGREVLPSDAEVYGFQTQSLLPPVVIAFHCCCLHHPFQVVLSSDEEALGFHTQSALTPRAYNCINCITGRPVLR